MKNLISQLADQYGVRIDILDSTTSTNDSARSDCYHQADAVIAESQTKGRGQRGNSWASDQSKNLTFSMVFEPIFLPAELQFHLSQSISLAITDTLTKYGIQSQIKWPNDIYCGDKKIAGILIENDIMGANLSRCIAGIGLNINQRQFPDWLPNPTSMALQLAHLAESADRIEEFDRAEVFIRLYHNLASRYTTLANREAKTLERDYLDRLYRFGMPHRYCDSNGEFTGTIRNVLGTGELIIEKSNGQTKSYLFKEIEFII